MKSKAQDGESRAPFSTVETCMWTDRKFLKLSRMKPSGQSLFYYLLTGPHDAAQRRTVPGVYRLGRAELIEALGWPPDEFDACCEEITALKMAEIDWENRIVWLRNALKHRMPRSPDNVRSWRASWDLLPDCVLKRRIYRAIRSLVCKKSALFEESFYSAVKPVALGSAGSGKSRKKADPSPNHKVIHPRTISEPSPDASPNHKVMHTQISTPKKVSEALTKVNAQPSGIRAHARKGFKTLEEPKTLNLKPLTPNPNPANGAPAPLTARGRARVREGNGKAPPDKDLSEFASVRRFAASALCEPRQGDLLDDEDGDATPDTAPEKLTGKSCKTSPAKAQGPETGPAWEAYREAFFGRYGVEPVRNAIVNAQMLHFVERIGRLEAAAVARFYVEHNDGYYVRRTHAVGLLLHDAEALRTQWATNRPMTGHASAMIDRTATNANAFAPLIAEAKAREKLEAEQHEH
jgi:hypothetical protein